MTIGVLTESILLKMNGGKPSPNNSVMRADIRALLPAAINYAMDKTYNLNLQIEGDRDFPSEFYTVFEEVTIIRDSTGSSSTSVHRLPYIELLAGTVPLKGGAGIRFVYDNCGAQYGPVSDSDMGSIEYYSKLTPGMGWYRRTGNKLTLYGVNPLAETINYQAITKVEDLFDDDEAPLQAGSEIDALNLMVGWFGQKLPYNTLVNSRDTNAVNT